MNYHDYNYPLNKKIIKPYFLKIKSWNKKILIIFNTAGFQQFNIVEFVFLFKFKNE